MSAQTIAFGVVGTNLSDLPTELLLIIIDLLDDKDLYHLALSSKHFHYLALPIYISRQDGRFLNGHVLISGFPFRMLQALRVALFVDSVIGLDVFFTAKDSVIQVMKELGRLIRRTTHIWSISINFTYLWGEWERGGLQESVADFLEAMTDKSCNKLHIRRLDVGANMPPEGKGKKRKMRRTKMVTPSQPSLSPREIRPLTTLNDLKIDRSDLHCPVLRAWVIKSINLSPITKLDLDNISFSKKPSSMSKLFHLLTLPSLTQLSISSATLIYQDLLNFLERHPRIQSLSISTDAAIPYKSPFPADTLPQLTMLKAPPHYICHLLASEESVPHLTHIIVDPDLPIMIYNDNQSEVVDRLKCIEECFMHVASRQNVTFLRFVLPFGSWAKEWLLRGSCPENGQRKDLERYLVNVTRVEVDVAGCQSFSPTIKPLLIRWLALFPALRSVSFDIFTFRMSAEEKSAFAKSIGDACHTIKMVEISYQKYFI